ncbi:DUF4097 family beta strand repeat-containing protein [Mucilaginibacter gossypii]|uniref:DUF4097 family beta strand repeat-containing protein n=1 Tax=Mucilaginibacter gossypii TaxID=551996 RepID=UPI000DCB6F8B|nr:MULTISPECIES: DUF4097 family beta strand repeat-containing protein [Mucilaginibacter]QTE38291.1 DUF4097 family beta strand repeat-containing protein [Mucilaginibacter gossypii]RAV49289.1 hypothetical protein DIU36_27880 [Mucilaginibacter rubeus]
MKKYLLVLFVACAGSSAFAQNNQKTPYLTKSLSGQAVKNVIVNTSGGSITVSGASGEEPRVEVFIQGNNGNNDLPKEEIKKRLDENYDLSIDVNGGELHAKAKSKHDGNWDWKKSLSISFRVYVPGSVATNLNTSGGSIHLDNLTGAQQFETSGGSLHLDKITGTIKGRTSGGSIHVSDSKESIDLQTSGGSIEARNCIGHIRLETSGGSLHLDGLKGDIKATTSGGSISGNKIDGDFITGTSGGSINLTDLSCSLDASTSAGSFHAQFLSVGKSVKIDVSSGHVDLQLPSKQGLNLDLRADKIETNLADNFSGSKDKERVEGKLNGGGALVEVRGNGRVNLNVN